MCIFFDFISNRTKTENRRLFSKKTNNLIISSERLERWMKSIFAEVFIGHFRKNWSVQNWGIIFKTSKILASRPSFLAFRLANYQYRSCIPFNKVQHQSVQLKYCRHNLGIPLRFKQGFQQPRRFLNLVNLYQLISNRFLLSLKFFR